MPDLQLPCNPLRVEPTVRLRPSDARTYAAAVRDLDTVDSELRLLDAVRRTIREHGGEPSSRQVDELLNERNQMIGS